MEAGATSPAGSWKMGQSVRITKRSGEASGKPVRRVLKLAKRLVELRALREQVRRAEQHREQALVKS
jgi:hypothetical protein